MSTEYGRIEAVALRDVGTALDGDHLVGAEALQVYEPAHFSEGGGTLLLDGVELVYTGWDEDASAIVLSVPLDADYEDGASVLVVPAATEVVAYISVDDDGGEGMEVLVPQDLRDKLPTGVRSPDERELVVLVEDEYGWVLHDVVREEPVIDGSYIDPTTLPPALPPEPVRPDSSPTPTVDGFAGVILARWLGVLNESSVTYEVHVAASNASAPSAATLLDETQATAHSVRTLPDGSALAYDATYYVAVVAKSGDLAADPSPWVAAQMDRTRNSDLAADAIDGMTITGARFRTASAGARVEIDTEDGLVGYAPDGVTARTRVDAVDGRLYTEDGVFSGTVTGGSISIAQGVASSLSEGFDSASGTTPPTGWTRATLESTVPDAGVYFDTTGGSPGRRMRLQLKPRGNGQRTRHVAYPSSVVAQDCKVAFDYMWTGTHDPVSNLGNSVHLALRASGALSAADGQSALTVRLRNGGVQIYAGYTRIFAVPGFNSDAFVDATRATPGEWYRVEVIAQGSSVSARAYPKGQPATPWTTSSITSLYPAAGIIGFVASASEAFSSPGGVDQAVHIDNVAIDVLQTGFSVAPDGTAASAGRFSVRSPQGADEAVPRSYVDSRRLDQLAIPTASVRLGAQRITELGTPQAADEAANKGYVDQGRGVAIYTRDSNQNIAHNSTTQWLNVNQASSENTGMWSRNSSDPFEFVCVEPAVYRMDLSVLWEGNSTNRRQIIPFINGSATNSQRRDELPGGSHSFAQQMAVVKRFGAGETVSFRAFQNSGTTLAITNQIVVITRLAP